MRLGPVTEPTRSTFFALASSPLDNSYNKEGEPIPVTSTHGPAVFTMLGGFRIPEPSWWVWGFPAKFVNPEREGVVGARDERPLNDVAVLNHKTLCQLEITYLMKIGNSEIMKVLDIPERGQR